MVCRKPVLANCPWGETLINLIEVKMFRFGREIEWYTIRLTTAWPWWRVETLIVNLAKESWEKEGERTRDGRKNGWKREGMWTLVLVQIRNEKRVHGLHVYTHTVQIHISICTLHTLDLEFSIPSSTSLLSCRRLQRNRLMSLLTQWTKDLGLGTMLKGGGRVLPLSKYDSQSLDLANFHSTSASS